jgi:broad specificity phosphatase PhoE
VSPPPVRFTFVRHGQSTANVSGRWRGHGDAPLSELGRAQAAAVAARLGGVAFDHVISSDLARARDTALALGLPVDVDPLFREIDVGAWEGRSQLEVAELFPDEVMELKRGAEHVKVGGGESWEEVHARIDRAVRSLRARLSGVREVGVFSHGGVLSSLFTGFFDVRGRHPRPLGHLVNTSVTVATIHEDSVELERYNDGSHHPSTAQFAPERFGATSAVIAAMAVGARDLHIEPSLVAGVSEILASPRDEAKAKALQAELDAPVRVTREPFERLIEDALPGRRALLLASPEEIKEAATHALRPGASSRVSLRLPGAGSVTHLIRTTKATMVGDYSVGGATDR